MKPGYSNKIVYNLISDSHKGNDMHFIFGFLIFLMSSLSFSAFAYDDPVVVEGAEKYDQMQCIDNETQNCINDACLNSEAIDCQENCKSMAQDKCQEQINE